jgi:hypothetical protein
MTEKQMLQIASTRLYYHFAKLYFPAELAKQNPENPTRETQHKAHTALVVYMCSRRPAGLRFYCFLEACDIRENRFLGMGGTAPSIKEEASALFEDAECLFAAKPIKYDA